MRNSMRLSGLVLALSLMVPVGLRAESTDQPAENQNADKRNTAASPNEQQLLKKLDQVLENEKSILEKLDGIKDQLNVIQVRATNG